MTIEKQTIEVIIPDEGKALKITNKGKLVMYMVEPYYKLPHYKYDVEEVDKAVAVKWLNDTNKLANKIFNKKVN